MEFQHEHNEKKGRFFSADGLAEIVYNLPNPGLIIIEHTEVDDSLAGKGIGKQLVDAVVLWARGENMKIVPLCVFAKGLMERKEEYKDMLYSM